MTITGSRINRFFFKSIPPAFYMALFLYIAFQIIGLFSRFHKDVSWIYPFVFLLILVFKALADACQIDAFEKEYGEFSSIKIYGGKLLIDDESFEIADIKEIMLRNYYGHYRFPLSYCDINLQKAGDESAYFSNYPSRIYCMERYGFMDAVVFSGFFRQNPYQSNFVQTLIENGLPKSRVKK